MKSNEKVCSLIEQARRDEHKACYTEYPELAKEMEKIKPKSKTIDKIFDVANDECFHKNIIEMAEKEFKCKRR